MMPIHDRKDKKGDETAMTGLENTEVPWRSLGPHVGLMTVLHESEYTGTV
jgi:hypothetical protein